MARSLEYHCISASLLVDLLIITAEKGCMTHVRRKSGTPALALLLSLMSHAWRPSLLSLGWRPPLQGWRPSLLGWRPSLVGCPQLVQEQAQCSRSSKGRVIMCSAMQRSQRIRRQLCQSIKTAAYRRLCGKTSRRLNMDHIGSWKWVPK